MLGVKGLSVTYPDGTKAVDNVSFEIKDGESVAFIGANGAGKTSLFLALVGILPAEGEVRVGELTLRRGAGEEVLRRLRREIGVVFQNPDDQLFLPTVYEDVAFGLRNKGMPEEEVGQRVDRCLSSLGIAQLKGRSPFKLSGGEKRMAELATVLVMEPSVMLFDEPTAFLDPHAKRMFADTIARLPQSRMIATHDMRFAERVCTRAVLMKEGKIFADGPVGELLGNSKILEDCGVEE